MANNKHIRPIILLIMGVMLLMCTLCVILLAFMYIEPTPGNLGFISLLFTMGVLGSFMYIDTYLEARKAK